MPKGRIFKSIIKGTINGFPLIQSIIKEVKGVKKDTVIPVDGSEPVKNNFDVVSIITELLIVILIISFVIGKIKIEDLENVIEILKNN